MQDLMNLSNTRVLLWATICLLLSCSTTTYAGAKIVIEPKMSTSWRVDSNYYGAETSERQTYTYLFQPGIKLGIETAKSSLLLDYTMDRHYYEDRDPVPAGEQETDEDDYIGHTGKLEIRYTPFVRLLLGLDESFYKTRDPAQSDEFSNSVDRGKYFINRVTPSVLYEFGRRFSIAMRYRNTEIDYTADNTEDSSEYRNILDLIYSFNDRASLDLECQHWEKDYDRTTSDYTSDQAKLVFRKQLKHLSLGIGCGYQKRDFDDGDIEDTEVFTYHIDFTGTGTVANRRSHVSLNIIQNFNDQGIGNRYYKATRIGVSAGHELSKKLSADISAYYQISDYEGTFGLTSAGNIEEREDGTSDISCTISYIIARWMTLSITGGYAERNSNIAGLDYDNSYFMANLRFAYSLGGK